ncbi:MAG: tetratricopeptide repeat protein [Gammaproteobacteria bacterium]
MNLPPDSERVRQVEQIFQQAEQFRAAGDTAQALNAYIQVTFRAPRHWLAYCYAGNLLGEIGRTQAAAVAIERARALAPDNAAARVMLGVACKNLGRKAQSDAEFERALALEPDNLHAQFNRAENLLRANHTQAALEAFDRLVEGERDADHIKAISRWLRGVARLTLGDYEGAWADYEARIHHPTTTFPELRGEKWTGQPLAGKTVFLAYEQRFGDVIQFCRFVPELVERGARVILQTPHELLRLFESLGEGVQLIEYKDPVPPYDYCQLVTSIPALLNYRREDVWTRPYLDVQPGTPGAALPLRPDTRLKVGLVWAGKPVPNRSIPLAALCPLLAHREVSFFSLQLGEERRQMRALAVDWLMTDLSPRITDFHDSSVLMKDLDLVITVDTAAAHQAGALGLPTWLLLIHYSDWRWGAFGDSTTAWYPSMRIFRQPEPDDWSSVSAELAAAFAEWVANNNGAPT